MTARERREVRQRLLRVDQAQVHVIEGRPRLFIRVDDPQVLDRVVPRVAVDVQIRDAHIIGPRQDTLRLGCGFKAIAFRVSHNGMADLVHAGGRRAILIAAPQIAEWQGAKQAEMIVEDVILV